MTGRPDEQTPRSQRVGRPQLDEAPRPRPLFAPASALILGIALSEWVGVLSGPARWCALLLPPAALLIRVFGHRFLVHRRTMAASLLLAAAFGVGIVRHQAATDRPANHVSHVLASEPILTRLTGEIITPPVGRPGELRNPFLPYDPPAHTRFVLALRTLQTTDPPTPICGRVHVNIEATELGLYVGQCVELTGRLYAPAPPHNPGETDWARWSHLQGIDAGMAVDGQVYVRPIAATGSPFRRFIAQARIFAQALLLEPCAEDGADPGMQLLDTMVLGRRGAANRPLNEAFLRAGGMHFLAVSGFHVGVLALLAAWLVRRFTGRTRPAALAILVVVLTYAIVAEPRAPILRATTLGVLASLAVLTRRPFALHNSLALAAIAILAYNPLELFRPGFQLSFVQVVGLITVVPWVYRTFVIRRQADEPPREAHTLWQLGLRWVRRSLLGLAIVCVVGWVLSLPLVMLHFGRIAPWGWLGTFLLALPVTACIVLSFLTMIAQLLQPPLVPVLAAALTWTTDVLLRLVGLFEYMPGAVVELTPPPAWLVIAAYGLCWLAITYAGRVAQSRRQYRHAAAQAAWEARTRKRCYVLAATAVGAFAMCFTWLLLSPTTHEPGCSVRVLSVGNGSTALVTTEDGHAAVIDAGTDRNHDVGETVTRALHSLGRRELDAILISHANFDHYSGVPTLLKHVSARALCWNPYFAEERRRSAAVRCFFDMLPPESPPTKILAADDRFSLGDVRVEVLWPSAGLDPETWKANDRSLVLRLHAGGRTVLLPGDIEAAAMRALLAAGSCRRGASGRRRAHCTAPRQRPAPRHRRVLRRRRSRVRRRLVDQAAPQNRAARPRHARSRLPTTHHARRRRHHHPPTTRRPDRHPGIPAAQRQPIEGDAARWQRHASFSLSLHALNRSTSSRPFLVCGVRATASSAFSSARSNSPSASNARASRNGGRKPRLSAVAAASGITAFSTSPSSKRHSPNSSAVLKCGCSKNDRSK